MLGRLERAFSGDTPGEHHASPIQRENTPLDCQKNMSYFLTYENGYDISS
jgi:hypothetical protein